MAKARILVVDNDTKTLEVCSGTLGRLPDVEYALETNEKNAVDRIGEQSFDLLIANIDSGDGFELFRKARQKDPHLSVLIFTENATANTAVACMKLGIADYINKPLSSDEFLATVRHLLEAERLREQYR